MICMNQKDFDEIARKSEDLVKWFVEQDMTIENAMFVLASTLVSFAKQFDIPKKQADEIYENVWKAVKTYNK